jgi:DNA repair protein RecO (recombination protein O)
MDESRNTSALVLNRQNYKESDTLVTVYSKNFGKLNLVARGTKKIKSKLAAHLEPLVLSDLMILKGRGRDYIGAAVVRKAYLNIREDLNRVYYAGKAINLFNRLVKEEHPDERLFLLITRWLDILDEKENDLSKEDGELLFAFFAFKLLAELGYQPELYHCLSCGKEVRAGKNSFSFKNGGIIEEVCLDKKEYLELRYNGGILPVSDNCIKLLRFITDNKFASAEKLKVDQKSMKELSNFVNNFINFIV